MGCLTSQKFCCWAGEHDLWCHYKQYKCVFSRHFKFRQLTKVIQAVRVGAILILLLYKLEVMRSLVSDHARIFPATVDNVTEALPRVLLHKELRRDVLHFHHFCAVRKAVHSSHANCHTTEHWRIRYAWLQHVFIIDLVMNNGCWNCALYLFQKSSLLSQSFTFLTLCIQRSTHLCNSAT